MREIEFRGKRLDNGEWVCGGIYQEPIDEIKDGRVYIIGGSLCDVGAAYEVDPKTVKATRNTHDNPELLK